MGVLVVAVLVVIIFVDSPVRVFLSFFFPCRFSFFFVFIARCGEYYIIILI
jgi:hypothetical protein